MVTPLNVLVRKLVYIWIEETKSIVELDPGGIQEVPEEFRDKFCIDTNFGNSTSNRYGKWVTNTDEKSNLVIKWVYFPFEIFPIEFKTNLLLLGIS